MIKHMLLYEHWFPQLYSDVLKVYVFVLFNPDL